MGHNFFNLKHHTERHHREAVVFPSPGLLIFACFFMYTAMMATKSVYLAEITYLMKIFEVDKASASMANTYYFVAYAGMQVALFSFVSKIDVRKYVVFTAPLSAVAIILMGFCDGMPGMCILFAIAGLLQAGVYSSANHVLTHYLPTKYLSRANTLMNFGFAAGTVFAYALSALCIGFDLWRLPFFICGGIMLLSVALYALCAFKAKETVDSLPAENATVPEEQPPLFPLRTKGGRTTFYLLSVLFIFLTASLYYAVMNWITSLLVDVYEMNQDISIYVSTLAPVLITLGPVMTIRSCDKDRDFIREGWIYMLFALPLPLLLAFFYDVNAILAFVMCALFVIITSGVKAIGVSIIAFKMRRTLNTAQFSAIANASGSLAGGIAPTLVGMIIDSKGWGASYLAIFIATVLITAALIAIDLIFKSSSNKTGQAE